MKLPLQNYLLRTAAIAVVIWPLAALAQPPQPSAVQSNKAVPPGASTSPMAGHPVSGQNAEERVERHIKELHSQLQITPAEEPQWNQFADLMRQNAREMDQAFSQRAQQFPTMNAVQNMQSYEQLAEEHAKRIQRLIPAFESLYNQMPDQQKRLADQVFRYNAEKQAVGAAQHRGRSG